MSNLFDRTHILGAYIVTVTKFCDDRGSFQELYNSNEAPESIRVDQFRQISVSSSKRDVLRGMHTSPYSKLVGVTSGAVYDVIVDLREDSPTFGKWIAHILSCQNCRQIHVPAGCAHGYLALEDTTMFYLQAGVFTPSLEQVRSFYLFKDIPTDIYYFHVYRIFHLSIET